jgi:hypothetical protein
MAHGGYKVPLNSFLVILYLRAPLQAQIIIVGITEELVRRRNIRNWRIVRAGLSETTYDVGTLTTSSECRTVELGTVNIPIPGCL